MPGKTPRALPDALLAGVAMKQDFAAIRFAPAEREWAPPTRWHDLAWWLLLFGCTLLVCFPALNGDFLLDDNAHIPRPELRSLAGLARIWTDVGATQQYYPVLHTAFWLEYQLWSDASPGYHLLNVLLHTTAAWLVVVVMRRLALPGGWLAAFVFALHPVAVESVAWISEQKNTLSTVFYLAAAIAFLRYLDRPALARHLLASAFFAAALLSKTATVTLPVALLIVIWWRRGRLDFKREILPLLPWLAAAFVAGAITIAVERALVSGIDADLSFAATDRMFIAARALWFYLGKLLWPVNLSFLYERWSVDAAHLSGFLVSVGAVAVAVILAWRVRQNRALIASLLFFVVTLLPVLGFVNVEWFVFSFVADHFLYLASLGVIVPLAATASARAATLGAGCLRSARLGAILLVGGLGALSWRHSHVFRDNVSLYENAMMKSPGSVPAHYLAGVALAGRPGRESEAAAAFEGALRLNPDAAEVHAKLSAVLLRIPGRRREAIDHGETALRLKPGLRGLHESLPAAWFDEGKWLAEEPNRSAEAIAAYRRALDLDRDFTEAHYNLANLLLRTPGRVSEAIVHFEAALRLKPDFPEAHTNLGTALATQPGRMQEAIAHFEAALRLNPDFAPARNNLAKARELR